MARKPPLPVDDHSSGLTRASAVYEQLRADITHGTLKPDTKLRVTAMSQRYGVGASPLREALSRLSAEGLVTHNEQRGFSVATLDWDDLSTLNKTRLQIESLALSDSIEHRTTKWEDKLVLVLHKLGRTPRSLSKGHYTPNPLWENLHREFHSGLRACCTSRWLIVFCENLADEAYRFRQLAAENVFSSRNQHEEHVALFNAAIHGKKKEALKLLEDHFNRTFSAVQSNARELGHLG
jgi:GntR family carbon starvation induced transcriptional regulator